MTTGNTTTGNDRHPRADARRNRARVLEAAEIVLARDGLTASMRAIAAQAGVGLGTIYRHFPTQERLYQAIITDRMHRLVNEADQLVTAPDPLAAFEAFFARVVETSARRKVLADAIAGAGLDPEAGLDAGLGAKAGSKENGRELRERLETLLTRAQQVGALRPDLSMPVLLALLAAACLAAERHRWSDELRTTTLAVLFDGLRAW